MKAMVFTAPSVVEILDVDEPTPAPGEVIVNVAAAGICGSELHGIQTPGFRQPPLVMGHEFAGTTSDGRRVVINPIVSCQECDLCKRDLQNLCRTRSVVGIHRAGGFAERVAVPETNVFEVPDEMSLTTAATIEPLANALHAWHLANDPDAKRVGIIGAGTIGLVCLLISKLKGAQHVAVADLSEERLDVVRKLGADETGPALEGEFDVIFDAVGVPATHTASVEKLRPGAATVWLGLISDEAHFNSHDLIRMEKRVLGMFAYPPRDFKETIPLAMQVETNWTTDFPLEEGAGIFTELMNGRTDIVKALLHP